MEDILKTFETYGPNPEIKDRILTDDVKTAFKCAYILFSFFVVVFKSLTLCLDFIFDLS